MNHKTLIIFFYFSSIYFFQVSIKSQQFEELVATKEYDKIQGFICPIQDQECIENSEEIFAENIIKYKIIGRGAFGKVFVFDETTAFKIQETSDLELALNFLREINIGYKINKWGSTFLAKINYCCSNQKTEPSKNIMRYFTTGNYYSFGDLDNFMKQKDNQGILMSPQWKWSIIKNTIEGIKTLQGSSYVHRDLKPANIFLSDAYHSVIGDFGFITKLQTPEMQASHIAGTLGYLPPEGLTNPIVSLGFDIYSLGIIFFEIMNASSYKFETLDTKNEIEGYCKVDTYSGFILKDWERYFYCTEIHNFVIKMIDNDRNQRPSISQIDDFIIEKHAKFMDMQESLENMAKDISKVELVIKDNEYKKRLTTNDNNDLFFI